MDVGQLLARMNPKTVNYMGVGGGEPELTTADIAGALAFVPRGLGRAVLEAVYWPGGETLRSSELVDEVMKVVIAELSRHAKELSDASLDVQLVQAAIRHKRAIPTAFQQQALTRAQLRLEAIKTASWPKNTIERIPLIVKAIIAELSGVIKCNACHGYGELIQQGISKKCDKCSGTGLECHSERRRALLIKCDHRDYLRRWKKVYDWIYKKIADAEKEASIQLLSVLRTEVSISAWGVADSPV